MTTEKTTAASTPLSSPTLLRADSQYQHAALKHFYGLDEDKRDQRLKEHGYTVKTLRYLLPMLTNKGRCIRYVYGKTGEALTFKETVHWLCLLSKALGRPGVLVLGDADASQGVRVLLILAQHVVVIKAASNVPLMLDQQKTLQALMQEQVLQKVWEASSLCTQAIDPKHSGPILVEWISKLLKKPLSEILSGALNVSDRQFFGLGQILDEKRFKKLRKHHERWLIDIPEKKVSSGVAQTEEQFVDSNVIKRYRSVCCRV